MGIYESGNMGMVNEEQEIIDIVVILLIILRFNTFEKLKFSTKKCEYRFFRELK